MNLIEELQEEMERNRELVKIYDECPTGSVASMLIRLDIKEAEKSMADGDTIKMMQCLETLRRNKV